MSVPKPSVDQKDTYALFVGSKKNAAFGWENPGTGRNLHFRGFGDKDTSGSCLGSKPPRFWPGKSGNWIRGFNGRLPHVGEVGHVVAGPRVLVPEGLGHVPPLVVARHSLGDPKQSVLVALVGRVCVCVRFWGCPESGGVFV